MRVGRGRDCPAVESQSAQREVAELGQLHLGLAPESVPQQRTRQLCDPAKPAHSADKPTRARVRVVSCSGDVDHRQDLSRGLDDRHGRPKADP